MEQGFLINIIEAEDGTARVTITSPKGRVTFDKMISAEKLQGLLEIVPEVKARREAEMNAATDAVL